MLGHLWEGFGSRLEAPAGQGGSSNEEPSKQPEVEVQDLAAEEAALELEAERLKKQRELNRELAKYTAAALDRMSTSILTLGLIGPGIGFLYHSTLMAALTNQELVVATISCLGVAFVLHWIGRTVLNEEFLK
ncbi:MAG: hypothetical protein E5W35_12415 [Mesorhizobium sp.]|nr:MAG: hypothetical protein E5W35_12415 [Mesorhizobium sp.]